MKGLNRVIIVGNLTRDPDLRNTVNKKVYARMNIAVNSSRKDANGEWQDAVDYITVIAWGNNAENAGKYLKKGSPVLVEGRIRTGSYEAKDGSGKRYTTDIWVDNMIMLGSRGQGGDSGYQSSGTIGTDYGAAGGYVPSDDDFGKNIGDSGFGDGGFSQGFADSNNGTPGGNTDSGIPF